MAGVRNETILRRPRRRLRLRPDRCCNRSSKGLTCFWPPWRRACRLRPPCVSPRSWAAGRSRMTTVASTRTTRPWVLGLIAWAPCTVQRDGRARTRGRGGYHALLVDGLIVAVVCERGLRVPWLEEARQNVGGLESLPTYFVATGRGGPPHHSHHSDVSGHSVGRDHGGVGNRAGIARRGDALDHPGQARHAARSCDVAANGAAESSVVGEERGRQAGAGLGIAKWLASAVF